jgi:argininosuccinate lyase
MVSTLVFRVDRMSEAAGAQYSTATDLADYLVRKGVPFREAHEIVGKTVRYALERGKELDQLAIEEFRRSSPLIDTDVYAAIAVEASLAARGVIGGTAPDAVRRQIVEARALIERGPRA